MHGVKRVMVFCLMTTVIPTILIITPLYLRHHVFADITYPVAESDVLAIQEGVSSIFCDALQLKMNSSFNAFQLTGTPKTTGKRKHIRLRKSMTLPDDTLEYWGFYLLKGALVRLKVCSRYDGARILVVRGEKNLETCGLMDHNYMKKDANMDKDFSRVKVTYERPAEVIAEIDIDADFNTADEDLSSDNRMSASNGNGTLKVEGNSGNSTGVRHRKRHTKRRWEKTEELKEMLEGEGKGTHRSRRSVSPIDAHITHGGNAFDFAANDTDSGSVSSFESGLLTCYDGKILLSRGFVPSRWCTSINYLDQSSRMVTEHLVASDGYYYYIFYSDNDFIKNDIHAKFDIYKPTYRFSDSSSKECINRTECEFKIDLMSDETVIVEVPTRDGIEHEEDDITFLTSTCKPRMGVYMIFPILVLLLILVCAFL